MTLLSLERVHKDRGAGRGRRAVLGEVSLRIQPGELAVVWGLRGSGRSTLLRIAAGIEPPDAGVVRFDGLDLARHAEQLLGAQLAYCQRKLSLVDRCSALEHVMVAALAHRVPPGPACARGQAALERAGVAHCAAMREHEMTPGERVRVALARTLTLGPRLIVIDEPVTGVELHERDAILALLRGLADEGTAILASTGESTSLSEADRALTLGAGELHGVESEPAPVFELRERDPIHV
jgi:ABC-type lipoprotein export system ATPase subunit